MHSVKAWIQASRLASQLYIFFPLLLGQACWVYQGNKMDWLVFFLVHLYGLSDQLYIVYANDYADVMTDRLNRTFIIFSGGSRVLVDGLLKPDSLKIASWAMAGLSLLCGVSLGILYQRWLAVVLVFCGLALLWMYSYPPIRLSYRGGGELLQMTGVGFVLPLIGYYGQSGNILGFPWQMMAAILPTQLACAMATSLPDEPSDMQSKKQTAVVVFGPQVTKQLILCLNLISIIALAIIAWLPASTTNTWPVLLLPIMAMTAALAFVKSDPGTTKLTIFVTLAVLSTLSLMGGITVALL